jgi:hypothetical protein
MDSYLVTGDMLSQTLAKKAPKKLLHAEGWTRHLHYGFGAENDDPLRDVLGRKYQRNPDYPSH